MKIVIRVLVAVLVLAGLYATTLFLKPISKIKASGNGREGGEMGLEDFLETKMVHGLA